MPLPLTGAGADVSKGLLKFSWALYLAASSSAAALPLAKLNAQEPASPWVRQGRLKSDAITWNIPEPGFMDGRAGFAGVLKWRVVTQAEIPRVNCPLDETDPDILNRLRGNAAGAATSLSSGAYTGYEFIYKPGLFYSAKVLLVGSGVPDTKERHVYSALAFVTFRLTGADNQPEGVDVSIDFGTDTSGNAFTMHDWA